MTIKIIKLSLLVFIGVSMATISCQKMDRPEIGKLILDTIPEAPPYNPVKTLFSFEGNSGDSGEAKSATIDSNVTYGTGVNGKAVIIGSKGYIVEKVVSDSLKNLGSFTLAFWMNTTGPVKDGARGIFAISNKTQFWGNLELFLENLDAGDTAFLKVHMFNASASDGVGEQWNEIKLPGALNKWTHIALTYDSASSKLNLYMDGALTSLSKVLSDGKYGGIRFNDVNGMVIGNYAFQPTPSLTNHGPEDWARSFSGSLDQLRLEKGAMTADEVNHLYTSKE